MTSGRYSGTRTAIWKDIFCRVKECASEPEVNPEIWVEAERLEAENMYPDKVMGYLSPSIANFHLMNTADFVQTMTWWPFLNILGAFPPLIIRVLDFDGGGQEKELLKASHAQAASSYPAYVFAHSAHSSRSPHLLQLPFLLPTCPNYHTHLLHPPRQLHLYPTCASPTPASPRPHR